MALINCPECNREITDKSKVCIHCGNPIEKKGLKTFSKIWVVICIITCFFISFIHATNFITKFLNIQLYYSVTTMACLSFLLGMCYISLLKNSNKTDLYRVVVVNLIILFFIISEVFI